MLSPVINATKDLLTQAFKEVMQLDKYSQTSDNIMIGKLPKDPDWLSSVRSRVSMLGKAGASWINQKPDIWSSILLQFPDYATSCASIADLQQQGKIKDDQWVQLLTDTLYNQLVKAVKVTTNANDNIKEEQAKFANILPLLEASIHEGWMALADEEQIMIKIAAELAQLQDTVASLEDSITSSVISSNKSIIVSSVTTVYKLVSTAGATVSFLSLVTSAITVGKMYYDIISNTAKINKTLDKIAELQVEASEEAQAAAGTKVVLQLLYNLEKTFERIQNVIPQIITMWETERDKVKAVIDALNAGAKPDTYFEIFTISTANANWQAINKFAASIPQLQYTIGKPVVLDPENARVTTTIKN